VKGLPPAPRPAESARRGVTGLAVSLLLTTMAAAACLPGVDSGAESFRDRLGLLPASAAVDADPLIVAIADLDRAAQLAGVQRPADAGDADAVADYVAAVTGVGGPNAGKPASVAALTPQTAHVERVAQVGEFADELGWSISDVSWFAEVQSSPNTLMVAGGDFDEARLNGAMGERRDDLWWLGGEDGEIDPTGITAARPLGESLRSTLADGHLVVGRTTPPVTDALDGDGPTLAHDTVLESLAQAMDDHDAYSALLTARGSYGVDPATVVRGGNPQAALAQLQDQVLPQPFRGVASGATVEDGAPIVLLAYAHDTAEAAQANATALGRIVEQGRSQRDNQPWSELVTVDEIRADGATLVARLRLAEHASPRLGYGLLLNRDSLVTHR
jgi:hypothetical protein